MAELYDVLYIFCNLTSVSKIKTINWMKMHRAPIAESELAIELTIGHC